MLGQGTTTRHTRWYSLDLVGLLDYDINVPKMAHYFTALPNFNFHLNELPSMKKK